MIPYPVTLPCPQVKSHAVSYADDMIKSNMDYGTERIYIQKSTEEFNFMVTCTYEQAQTFKAFYDDDLINGVSPFTADWLLLGDATTKNIRFTSQYTIKPLGASKYEFKANCEIL